MRLKNCTSTIVQALRQSASRQQRCRSAPKSAFTDFCLAMTVNELKKKIYDLKKDIQKLWIKTKRQHDKKGNGEFHRYAYSCKQRQENIENIHCPRRECTKNDCRFLYRACLRVFLKLKTLTNFTTYNTQQNVGDAFVAAVLFMMRSGLRIDDFDVITKDFF